MNIVFLDTETFNIELPPTSNIGNWQSYSYTPQDPEIIIERLHDADIAITNKIVLTRDILAKLPNLKMIQITATGMNNVDTEACDDLGIVCKNVSGYAEHTVAEHTFALLLSLTRNIAYFNSSVAEGSWTTARQFCLIDRPNIDLKGKTLGIIGYGTTGKRVAEIAKVFGMHVLVAEHKGKTPRNNTYTSFNDTLAQSDIISLHCPLTPETNELINNSTIALMNKQPILLNLARGGVINEQDVADALQNQTISGFATDVLSTEPPSVDNPLLHSHTANVIITPHNAWGSIEAQTQLWKTACQQITDFMKQQ